MIELTQEFGFEAAHTLERAVGTEASRRVHGHSYRACLVFRGEPDHDTGMLVDLGTIDGVIGELRAALDHRLLDEVDGLAPATMENIAAYVFRAARARLPLLAGVTVRRDSIGQTCTYTPGAPDI